MVDAAASAAAVLRRVPWMSALGPEAVADLAHYAVRKGARAGQVLVRAGFSSELLVVLTGCLEVTRLGDLSAAPRTPRRLLPGDVIGLSQLAGGRNEQDVVAVESSSVLQVPLQAVKAILMRDPEAAVRAMARMADTQAARGDTLDGARSQSLERRLVEVLVELAGRTRAVTAPREEIAKRLGASRDLVQRELKRLEGEGRVVLRRGRIELISLARR